LHGLDTRARAIIAPVLQATSPTTGTQQAQRQQYQQQLGGSEPQCSLRGAVSLQCTTPVEDGVAVPVS
jgi:hypothetical protein